MEADRILFKKPTTIESLDAMSKQLSIVQIALIIAFALAVGIGLVYTPILTFVAIAAVVVSGVWLYTDDSGYYDLNAWRELPVGIPGDTELRGDLITKLTSVFLLLWWLTGILAHGRVWSTASQLDYNVFLQNAVEQQGGGILLNQLLVISFGAVGIIFLVAAVKHTTSRTLTWVLMLWVLYLCWGCLTLFWSVDPSATVRRLVGFALISLGSVGFGAGFYGSRPNGRHLFLRHVIIGGVLSALIFLLPLASRWNEVELLDPSYMLQSSSNTWSYVAYPALIALMMLLASSILDLREWRSHDWFLVGVLSLAVLVLKTRGPTLFVALALGTVYLLYKGRLHNRVFQIGLLMLSFIGVCFIYSSKRALDLIILYLTRGGSEEQIYSLTNRLPLWEYLLAEIQQNPVFGVGFGAYWTVENLLQLNLTLSFTQQTFVVAHNGYIEEVLATGVIGLTLLVLFWIYVMYIALRRGHQGDSFGWLTFSFMLVYLLVNLTQSLMQWYHHFFPFIVPLALIGLLESTRSAKDYEAVKDP